MQLPAGKAREQAIAELRADPAVAYAEPNYVLTHQAIATDPYFTDGRLWGMYGDASTPANQYGSQAAEAWARGNTGSSSVYVGVIDEGIQYTHPDLDANVWTNPFDPADGRDNDGNGYVDDVRGWDFANGDSSIYDGGNRGSLDDHGTHVSGTIAGEANNGTGVAGVTWSTKLISGKFLGRNGGSLAAAVKAVDYFTDLKTRHGLNLVATSNSWGGGAYSQALYDAIARANTANILFIAAAGNSGTNNDTTASYPSGYEVAERHRGRGDRQDRWPRVLQPVRGEDRRHRRARRGRLVDDRVQHVLVLQRHLDGDAARERCCRALRRVAPGRHGRRDQDGDPDLRGPDRVAQRQDRHRRTAERLRLLAPAHPARSASTSAGGPGRRTSGSCRTHVAGSAHALPRTRLLAQPAVRRRRHDGEHRVPQRRARAGRRGLVGRAAP